MWFKWSTKRAQSGDSSKPTLARRSMPLVATLAAFVGSGAGSLSSMELTASMRDQHFMQVRELIDRELFLVAERAIEDFSRQQYPDPTFFRKGLDFYYAKMATETAPAYLDIDAFRVKSKELEEELQANRSSLPEPVNALFGAGIQRLATVLLRKFTPNFPPPAIKMNPNEVMSYQERMRSLINLTEAALAEKMAEIEQHKADETRAAEELRGQEDKAAEYGQIMQKATLLREGYLDIFLMAHIPLREVALRGAEYGIDQAFIDQEIKPWINNFIAGGQEQFKEWNWAYGNFYIFIKHKCNLMRSLNIARTSTEERDLKFGVDTFYHILDGDYSTLPKKAQTFINAWLLIVWKDLFCWMQEVESDEWRRQQLPEILNKLDEWLKEKGYSLRSSNRDVVIRLSEVYFQAAHLADQIGDTSRRDTLIIGIQNSKSPYKQNASKMLGYFASRGDENSAGGWLDPVVAAPADRALSTGRAFINQAAQALDPQIALRFHTNAAVNLRSGLAGLPSDSKNPEFVELAPDLVYFYVYSLYKLGWYDLALSSGLQWLDTFEPNLWGEKPSGKNPYFKKGELTEAGQRVRSLAGLVVGCGQKIASISNSPTMKKMFTKALELQAQFDPAAVEGSGRKMQIVVPLQQGEYDEADRQAEIYAKDMRKKAKEAGRDKQKFNEAQQEVFWALRMATTARYLKWNEGWETMTPERLEEASVAMNKYANVLIPFAQRVLSDENASSELATEARKAWNLGVSIRVAGMFKAQQYTEIINFLDKDFWANAPRDDVVNKQLMGWLTNAATLLVDAMTAELTEGLQRAVKLRGEAGAEQEKESLATFVTKVLAQAEVLEQVVKQYRYLLNKQPNLDEALTSSRLHLVKLTQNINSNLLLALKKPEDSPIWSMVVEQSANDELADVSAVLAAVRAAQAEAKALFADTYAPLIGPTTPAKNIYATAEALQISGQEARAAQLFELFLEVQGQNRELIDFIADPLPLLKEVADIAAPGNRFDLAGPFNPAYKPESKGKKLQPIWEQALFADRLYDDEKFRAALVKRQNIKDLGIRKEERRNYAAALQAFRVYRRQLYEKQRVGLGQVYDDGVKALARLESLIMEAYLRYDVTERLLNYYRVGDEPQKAIPLARELYAYDPKSLSFQSAFVDTVLISHRQSGGIAGADDLTTPLEEALDIAVGLRKQFRDGTDTVAFWNARVQVFELLIALGRGEEVRDRDLRRQQTARNFPWLECFEVFEAGLESGVPGQTWIQPEEVPWASLHDGQGIVYDDKNGERVVLGRLSRRAVSVCKRYMELYEAVGIAPPVVFEQKLQENEMGQQITVNIFNAGGQ